MSDLRDYGATASSPLHPAGESTSTPALQPPAAGAVPASSAASTTSTTPARSIADSVAPLLQLRARTAAASAQASQPLPPADSTATVPPADMPPSVSIVPEQLVAGMDTFAHDTINVDASPTAAGAIPDVGDGGGTTGGGGGGGMRKRDLLKKNVRKLIHARSLFSTYGTHKHGGFRRPGLPPGVDVKRPQPELEELFKSEALIRVVDFSATRYQFNDLSRHTLAEFLETPRPAWAKTRWIDVRGINYPVIGMLGEKYHLHPLAVEDVFHSPQPIKADWYENHIYISMVLCALEEARTEAKATAMASVSGSPRSPVAPMPEFSHPLVEKPEGPPRAPLFSTRHRYYQPPGLPDLPTIEVEQLNIFLLRDGTMISIFQSDGETACAPLYSRLEEEGTLIRNAEDASFLLFSMIDVVTDHFFPILDAYRLQLDTMEEYVLQSPAAEATQELHLIAKELSILRRTLLPSGNLVASLRENRSNGAVLNAPAPGVPAATATPPLISKLTRTYLADVKDHVSTVVDGLECFESDARHLIDLIFNTVSHSTNEAMRTLALISLLFLPLGFLAGVFGMNFERFPELKWDLGIYGFWIITAAIVFVQLCWFQYMGWIGSVSRKKKPKTK
ncbi:hypothetical protein HDU87_006786 [Geranomyces variabilis]|uniref:Uncharacterized protein n=1 Tax=Geranomyces variabilis TaxID=109894 RepID=A0AAD5TQI5_9FUNG|nr:hypothetical protein HDU87_006786 [Geranomyces variabilis]